MQSSCGLSATAELLVLLVFEVIPANVYCFFTTDVYFPEIQCALSRPGLDRGMPVVNYLNTTLTWRGHKSFLCSAPNDICAILGYCGCPGVTVRRFIVAG